MFVINTDLSKATVKAPTVIAIGPKGGKIIGYKAGKPVYLNEKAEENDGAYAFFGKGGLHIPKSLRTSLSKYIDAHETLTAASGTTVTPHGTKENIFIVSIPKNFEDVNKDLFETLMKEKGVKVSKSIIKATGRTSFLVKTPDSAQVGAAAKPPTPAPEPKQEAVALPNVDAAPEKPPKSPTKPLPIPKSKPWIQSLPPGTVLVLLSGGVNITVPPNGLAKQTVNSIFAEPHKWGVETPPGYSPAGAHPLQPEQDKAGHWLANDLTYTNLRKNGRQLALSYLQGSSVSGITVTQESKVFLFDQKLHGKDAGKVSVEAVADIGGSEKALDSMVNSIEYDAEDAQKSLSAVFNLMYQQPQAGAFQIAKGDVVAHKMGHQTEFFVWDGAKPVKIAHSQQEKVAGQKKKSRFLVLESGATPPGIATDTETKSDLVVEAEPKPEPEPEPPGPVTFDVNEGKIIGTLPGGHAPLLMQTPNGQKFVFKPSTTQAGAFDQFIHQAEMDASVIANIITGLTPVATEAKYKGKTGTTQAFVDGYKDLPSDLGKLNKKQVSQLVAHMIADRIISNNDAHSGQFGLDAKGNVIGIDKGQAMKFFAETMPDGTKVKPNPYLSDSNSDAEWNPYYLPPGNFGAPIYGKLMDAVKSGKVQVDLQSPIIQGALAKAKEIADGKHEIFPGYSALTSSPDTLVQAVRVRAGKTAEEVQKLFSPTKSDSASLDPKELLKSTKIKMEGPNSSDADLYGATFDYYKTEYTVVRRGKEANFTQNDWYAVPTSLLKKPSQWEQNSILKTANGIRGSKGFKPLGNVSIFYSDIPEDATITKTTAAQAKAISGALKQKVPGTGKSFNQFLKGFQSNGVHAWMVGGVVRDAFAGVVSKDVDFTVSCTTTDAANVLSKVYSGSGLKTNKGQALAKIQKGQGDGIDVASMRNSEFNNTFWEKDSDESGLSASIAQDSICRDFACNALYYDPENKTIIDATGRGADDAEKMILHPPTDDTEAWLKSNGPRNFARMFKFIGRGYTTSPELTAICEKHFVEQYKRGQKLNPGSVSSAFYGASSKYGGMGSAAWQAQGKVMKNWIDQNIASAKVRSSMKKFLSENAGIY